MRTGAYKIWIVNICTIIIYRMGERWKIYNAALHGSILGLIHVCLRPLLKLKLWKSMLMRTFYSSCLKELIGCDPSSPQSIGMGVRTDELVRNYSRLRTKSPSVCANRHPDSGRRRLDVRFKRGSEPGECLEVTRTLPSRSRLCSRIS